MLEPVIRFLLRKYPQQKVEALISAVWIPLMQHEGLRGERTATIDACDALLVDMVQKIPFLKVEVDCQVQFCEYDASLLPAITFECGSEALRFLAHNAYDQFALDSEVTSTDNDASITSTGGNILRDLKMLALYTPRGVTQYGEGYLKTGEVGFLADALLTEPSNRFFYSLFVLLAGFGERGAIKDALVQITRLIFYNSQGSNRITDSVAEKRIRDLISWFEGARLLDKDLVPVFAVRKSLLLKKKVDFSLFEYGLVIAKDYQVRFFEANCEAIPIGKTRPGKFIFSEREYEITFVNMRRGARSDTIQIRYDGNRELRDELLQRFRVSYDYIREHKSKKRQRVDVPDNLAEYLLIYATAKPYTYRIEFMTADEQEEYKRVIDKLQQSGQNNVEAICEMSDTEFNNYLSTLRDDEATYTTRQGLVKYRKYRNTLVNDLKARYHNCCQICLHSFKDPYGKEYSEGHHINSFAASEDHSPENVVILCPNHHRIIHKANARFDREQKAFVFENGHTEYLQLNHHL